MKTYVLIENYSGFVWYEAVATDPIEACRIADRDIGEEADSYEIVYQPTHGSYNVHEAPADWQPVADGQDPSEIERAAALPRVATVQYRRELP